MKNKSKIIARILALTSALVLVVALALPCFADTSITDRSEEVLIAFNNMLPASMNTDAYHEFLSVYGNDLFTYDTFVSGTFYNGTVDTGLYSLSNYLGFIECVTFAYVKIIGDEPRHIIVPKGEKYYVGLNSLDGINVNFSVLTSLDFENYEEIATVVYTQSVDTDGMILLTPSSFRLFGTELPLEAVEVIQFGFVASHQDVVTMNTIPKVLFNDGAVASPREFYNAYFYNRTDGVVPPLKSGMFGQLYYILGDAIFGTTVGIGTAQEFALSLVCTLLVFIVILLPVLLVVAMVFKLFRW